METIFVKEYDQPRKWYVIDAAGKPLGRVAAKAAYIARGKNKATYTKNQLMGEKRAEEDLLSPHRICWWSPRSHL